jgi:hypothetical protein
MKKEKNKYKYICVNFPDLVVIILNNCDTTESTETSSSRLFRDISDFVKWRQEEKKTKQSFSLVK